MGKFWQYLEFIIFPMHITNRKNNSFNNTVHKFVFIFDRIQSDLVHHRYTGCFVVGVQSLNHLLNKQNEVGLLYNLIRNFA